MDVHKASIDIALAESDGQQEVRHYGGIGGNLPTLGLAVRKVQAAGQTLHFVYEAGPCGYVIYRHLASKGLDWGGGKRFIFSTKGHFLRTYSKRGR